jgi:sulfite reductase alpha subunit-like flavoprotein
MGRDVDGTLARILAEPHGDLDSGRAQLAALANADRYQRDVY